MNEVYDFAFPTKKRMYNTCLNKEFYVKDASDRKHIENHIDKKDHIFSKEHAINTQALEEYLKSINHNLVIDTDNLIDLSDPVNEMTCQQQPQKRPGKFGNNDQDYSDDLVNGYDDPQQQLQQLLQQDQPHHNPQQLQQQ